MYVGIAFAGKEHNWKVGRENMRVEYSAVWGSACHRDIRRSFEILGQTWV
jgi:hypothetical protein